MRIRLAENFRALFYAPFYAAHALGFYDRESVDVEFVGSSVPGDGASAVLDGSVDLAWGGPMRVMKANERRPGSLVCFCEVVGRDPFFLVGRSNARSFRLADLGSLSFAAVTEVPTPWLCLAHDLRENGIDPAIVNRAPARSMAENFEALCSGELDVAQVFEPYASMALRKGAGDILYSGSERGPTVYTTFIATPDGIARHRSAFAKVARAIGLMQNWLAEHSPDEVAEVTQSFFPDIESQLLVSSLWRYRQAGIWASAPDVSHSGFKRLAESLLAGGFLRRMPAYEDCVDESLCAPS